MTSSSSDPPPQPDVLARAAALLADAEALVLATGAGMGVDAGLPDFRGPEGFWRAYPPYRALGLRFEELANPRWFVDDPPLAWGFYGHRLALYRRSSPHAGYAAFLALASRTAAGAFAFTSNVDGHLQRAGFSDDRVAEVHGAFAALQCARRQSCGLWSATDTHVDVDDQCRAREPLPRCPTCAALARPNILMFGDWGFVPDRTDAQLARLERWLSERRLSRVCVVECGAGTAVPTVRGFSENLLGQGAALVRINVREPEVPARGRAVGISAGARVTLCALAERLGCASGAGASGTNASETSEGG